MSFLHFLRLKNFLYFSVRHLRSNIDIFSRGNAASAAVAVGGLLCKISFVFGSVNYAHNT